MYISKIEELFSFVIEVLYIFFPRVNANWAQLSPSPWGGGGEVLQILSMIEWEIEGGEREKMMYGKRFPQITEPLYLFRIQ